MKLEVVEGLTLHGDNEMSIALTKHVESQNCTKNIDVQHHYIQKLVNKGELTVKWILGSEMLADSMTKALPTETFRKYKALLEMSINWNEKRGLIEAFLETWEPNRELASQHLKEFEKFNQGWIGSLIESWPPTSRPNKGLAIDRLLALDDRAMRRELISPSMSK